MFVSTLSPERIQQIENDIAVPELLAVMLNAQSPCAVSDLVARTPFKREFILEALEYIHARGVIQPVSGVDYADGEKQTYDTYTWEIKPTRMVTALFLVKRAADIQELASLVPNPVLLQAYIKTITTEINADPAPGYVLSWIKRNTKKVRAIKKQYDKAIRGGEV